MVRSERSKRKNSRISAVLLTILAVVTAALVFLYRDKFSSAALSGRSEDLADMVSNSEPFTYETGSRQSFALMGENLAVASTTGLQLLGRDGSTVSREVFAMANPAVCANKAGCAFYDVGGYSLRVYLDGEFVRLDRESEIISVSVSVSGFYAVSGCEPGYKGSVTVYDARLEDVYKWYSGTGYLVDAAVSPDGTSLAALCVEATGSVVHLFRLDSEEEYASVSLPNTVAFKLSFEAGGNFCVLSESAISFFSSGGEALSVYDFGSSFLADFELSESVRAVVLSKYVSGSDVLLVGFNADGSSPSELALAADPLSLASQDGRLLVLGAADIALYSGDLRLLARNRVVPGFSSAVLLPKGGVLLLSSRYGENCEFS
ncbi:MAG: DUF5711 family protein [Oscillospiraceae bacterium]|jgi:WD40 repeat protein|nr:DUF5711 family protein [Oscillospiraceae bacterium]